MQNFSFLIILLNTKQTPNTNLTTKNSLYVHVRVYSRIFKTISNLSEDLAFGYMGISDASITNIETKNHTFAKNLHHSLMAVRIKGGFYEFYSSTCLAGLVIKKEVKGVYNSLETILVFGSLYDL